MGTLRRLVATVVFLVGVSGWTINGIDGSILRFWNLDRPPMWAYTVNMFIRFFCKAVSISILLAASNSVAQDWSNDLSSIPTESWDYGKAAHLLERAGFGGTPDEIEHLAAMTPEEAVGYLVNYESVDDSGLIPFEHSGVWNDAMDPFPKSRADAVRQAREHGESMGVPVNLEGTRRIQPIVNEFFYCLRANEMELRRLSTWWADRMLTTPRPLQEKMALFWHGHFATSDTKVRDYRKMLLQLELFQAKGMSNFRNLLLGVTQDPAMLVFLDNGQNVKAHPNENFGRELMELFTMGDGNYTEKDIREASRAFTGWTDRKLQFVVLEDEHDTGEKTVLGKTGNFDGEEIIDIILTQSATADRIVEKLYHFFVRSEIDEETHRSLAKQFRDSEYEIRPLLKTIFLSKDFYSDESRASLVKSPVQLAVSTYKRMGLAALPTIPDFNQTTGTLGQTLFRPPNVAGWAGGRTWITPATLLERGNFVERTLFPDVEGFLRRDGKIPYVYARVGQRMAQGMNITEATMSGDSAFNKMADADEDYNTRYGGYMGYVKAYEVLIPIPRAKAQVDLTKMVRDAGVLTVDDAVDYFAKRFLLVTLEEADENELVTFLTKKLGGESLDYKSNELEIPLRELVHMVMSLPEYQLS
jgi:uncharacterized protein (DUF1800 family)